MLLCYSFVQFFVRLFDDLNDDPEYHYIYPAPDVDMRRQTSMHISTCRRTVKDVDMHIFDARRRAWTCII